MSHRVRKASAVALVVAGALTTFAAVAAVFLTHVLVNGDEFADRVTVAVKRPAVSREVSDRLAEAIVDEFPDLVAGQRMLEDTGTAVVSSGALDPVVREGARVLHDEAFSKRGRQLELDLADGLQLLGSFMATRGHPERGTTIPEATVLELRNDGTIRRLILVSDTISELAWLLPAAAIVVFAGAIALAPRRARAVAWAGYAVVAAGVGLLALDLGARVAVGLQGFAAKAAVSEVLDVFLGGLTTLALALCVSGALLTAFASGRFRAGTADRVLARALGLLRVPSANPRWRAVRVALLLVAGTLFIAEPGPVVRVLLFGVGFLVLVEALTSLVDLLGGPATQERAARPDSSRRRLLVVGVATAGLAGIFTVAAFGLTRTPGAGTRLAAACNGSPRLCDRPLDSIAFATSHNAMSSAADGFTNPNNRRSLTQQLDAGIRGLLIDSVSARPTARRSTAITEMQGQVFEVARRTIGLPGTEAIQDVIGRELARPVGPPEPFLCHALCELGAVRMEDELRSVHDWLAAHPREVVVIVIQDLVTPKETEAVFRRSGLYDDAFTWKRSEAAPTLREMIEADKRLLVMPEAHGVAGSWYQPGYARFLKETPFKNKSVAELATSCRPTHRGHESNPLFLVNHFVERYPPRPSDAKKANARRILLAHLRLCEKRRRAFPNLIAVDFAGIGDVVEVAAELNGVVSPN